MPLKNKNILVTGASRGIGRAIAQQLATAGATVALHYSSSQEGAEQTLATLEGTGHCLLRSDLSTENSGAALAEAAIQSLGRVDILVNNAGVFEVHDPASVSIGEWQAAWRRTVAVNLLAPADLSLTLGQHMVLQGGGKIVNIGSRGAFRGEPEAPAYGASKAALHSMSQSLAKRLAPLGVMVYAIAPGWVATDMAAPFAEGAAGEAVRQQSPLGRLADPAEIARTVEFLCSEGTESLTGCIIDINGASYLRT